MWFNPLHNHALYQNQIHKASLSTFANKEHRSNNRTKVSKHLAPATIAYNVYLQIHLVQYSREQYFPLSIVTIPCRIIELWLSKHGTIGERDHKFGGDLFPIIYVLRNLETSLHRLIHVPPKLITWHSGEFINMLNGNCLYNKESMSGKYRG